MYSPAMRRKKNIPAGIDPEYFRKQKAALVRRHRQVIYLNDNEISAIEQYCGNFGVHARSALYRQAIMEKILSGLRDNPPTLF